MRTLIVLAITLAILAVQFYCGVRRKKLLGAVIPLMMLVLFMCISFLERTTDYIATGGFCVSAIFVVWVIGFYKSSKFEKIEIDKMKTKDL